MVAQQTGYPAVLEVDPAAAQSRLSVFFRIILVIPQIIVLYFVNLVGSLFTLLAWFAILFTGRYPAGFAGFTAGWLRWTVRVNGYVFLLTGKYPPFSLGEESSYPVRPDVTVTLEGRNRLTVFFRPIVAIPHFIVLVVLVIVAEVVWFIAWLVALFTGSVPAGLHGFLANVQRYAMRVSAYIYLLTDQYPPFSLS